MHPHDAVLAMQDRHIATIGWAVTGVFPADADDAAPFAYTVGLTEHDQPEFVIAGLHHLIAGTLLNDMAARVLHDGATFTHGQAIDDLIHGYPAILIDGTRTEQLHPGTAIARYGPARVRLRQIVWPDPDGRFPWQPGYAHPPQVQPLIGQP